MLMVAILKIHCNPVACNLLFTVCIDSTDFIMVPTKFMLFTWNFIFDGDLSFGCFPSDFQFSWYHSFGLTSAMETDSDAGLCTNIDQFKN
jgi:hypothetical protein